jgi:hypothetical protein
MRGPIVIIFPHAASHRLHGSFDGLHSLDWPWSFGRGDDALGLMEGMFEVSNPYLVSYVPVIGVVALGLFEVLAESVAPEGILHQ